MDPDTSERPPAAPESRRSASPASDVAPSPAAVRRRRLPRPETILLLISLVWTIAVKLYVFRGQRPDDTLAALVEASMGDVAFFAGAALLLAVCHLLPMAVFAARLTLLLAAVILAWSMANAAWLLATSVQLQPGVLGVLLREPTEFWPTVQTHLASRPVYAIPIVATVVVGGGWLLWRLIGPVVVPFSARRQLVHIAVAAAVLAASGGWHWLDHRRGHVAYSGQVIGFSSHWYALRQLVSDAAAPRDVVRPERVLPRVGDRAIVWPILDHAVPNVVLVVLESVSHDATTLGGRDTTPVLAGLAVEGVEFVSTRTPVAQANKALWSVLTGSMPDVQPDHAEAIMADEPYEGLASVLAATGYRSAFFEMSKGSFECAPGFFSNLAFDWAWFRENLQDPSAHLGDMNGDDFRMIEPMFEWVDADAAPFFLGLTTTVAHDPHELPAWYEHEPSEDRFERYLESVRFTDAFLGAVVDELRKRGALENTLLCVVGDHGDGSRPESRSGRWAPFEEVIRVPWVIHWPAGLPGGRRVEGACSQLDVTPTILALLGADVDAAGFEGVDALGPLDAERTHFFSTWYEDSPVGSVQGARKLVYWPSTDTLFEYDLDADPGETAPRTIDDPEKSRVVDEIRLWQEQSAFVIPARRFREGVKYRHWRVISAGRWAWAYFIPDAPEHEP